MSASRHKTCAILLGASLCVLTGAPARSLWAASRESPAGKALIASFRRPSASPHSEGDDPTTAAGIALGRSLFFDTRLSGSGAVSCGSCHKPALGWQDGLPTAVGERGATSPRRTPTVLDVGFVGPLFWDGRAETLEDQVRGPLASKAEMNMPGDRLVERIGSIPGYARAFDTAFPKEGVSIGTLAKAIAAFERTLISSPAPFDRWVEGDPGAISAEAKRGFRIFTGKAGCASCHSGWRFTDDGFRDIGLPSPDPGRGKIVPGVVLLRYAFKTPTLRNVAGRAPYMHDGSAPTLEAVVDHYDHGFIRRPSLAPQIKPLRLTPAERADLVVFMRTLTSDAGPSIVDARPVLSGAEASR